MNWGILKSSCLFRLPRLWAATAYWQGSLSVWACCTIRLCWTHGNGKRDSLFCKSPTSSFVQEMMELLRTLLIWNACRSSVSLSSTLLFYGLCLYYMLICGCYFSVLNAQGIASETENHEKKDILVLVEKGRWALTLEIWSDLQIYEFRQPNKSTNGSWSKMVFCVFRTLHLQGMGRTDFSLWYADIQKAAGGKANTLKDQQLSRNDIPIIVDSCIAFITQYGKDTYCVIKCTYEYTLCLYPLWM